MPVPPPVQTGESTASDASDKVIPIRPKAEAAAKREAAVTGAGCAAGSCRPGEKEGRIEEEKSDSRYH